MPRKKVTRIASRAAVAPAVTPKTPDEQKASALIDAADALGKLYHLEMLADYTGNLATALDNLAHASAMATIAKHGSDADRRNVVAYLKSWFDEYHFRE